MTIYNSMLLLFTIYATAAPFWSPENWRFTTVYYFFLRFMPQLPHLVHPKMTIYNSILFFTIYATAAPFGSPKNWRFTTIYYFFLRFMPQLPHFCHPKMTIYNTILFFLRFMPQLPHLGRPKIDDLQQYATFFLRFMPQLPLKSTDWPHQAKFCSVKGNIRD